MSEKPMFDGSEPVDDYLNRQTGLRQKREKIDSQINRLDQAHSGPGGSEDIAVWDQPENVTVGELQASKKAERDEIDRQIKEGIRKELILTDRPEEKVSTIETGTATLEPDEGEPQEIED